MHIDNCNCHPYPAPINEEATTEQTNTPQNNDNSSDEPTHDNNASEVTPLHDDNESPGAYVAALIGGVVGGFVAILVAAAAIGYVVVAQVKRHLHPPKVPEREDMQLNNPVYITGDQLMCDTS